MTSQAQLSSDEAKQVVLNLGAAINDESFHTARLYVAEDMRYDGPFGTRVGAEAYLKEIERLTSEVSYSTDFCEPGRCVRPLQHRHRGHHSIRLRLVSNQRRKSRLP